jgi:hypothetical protein
MYCDILKAVVFFTIILGVGVFYTPNGDYQCRWGYTYVYGR